MTSPEEFREFGKAMIDYVADYLENIRDRPVLPSVKPGYLQQLVPEEAPEEPEKWQVSFLETGPSILAKIQPRKYFLKVLGPHEFPSKIVICSKCCFLIENLLNFLIRP